MAGPGDALEILGVIGQLAMAPSGRPSSQRIWVRDGRSIHAEGLPPEELAKVIALARSMAVINTGEKGEADLKADPPKMGNGSTLVVVAREGLDRYTEAGTQLHVRDLQPQILPANDQRLFAPVERDGLAKLEAVRHEGIANLYAALARPPLPEYSVSRL